MVQPNPPLRVLSYNIHKGFSVGNFRYLLDEIREAIRVVDADLVFLQEVCGQDPQTSPVDLVSQFEFLADSVWSHYAYGQNSAYRSGNHGNAILSKFPITQQENIDISVGGISQRGILHCTLNLHPSTSDEDGISLHAMCVHLGLFELERRHQLKKLCDRIITNIPEGDPIILAGDFNDWRLTFDREFRGRLDLKESYRQVHGRLARTFPAWKPVFSLDRIYSRGLEVVDAKILTGAPWNRLSDHAALWIAYQ
jgi:endonuclease/exonuclease/phosphatase family metal-dependent hydrolase